MTCGTISKCRRCHKPVEGCGPVDSFCNCPTISTSSVFCEHANECPAVCPCDADCYCKSHTCAPRARDSTMPAPAGLTAEERELWTRSLSGSWEMLDNQQPAYLNIGLSKKRLQDLLSELAVARGASDQNSPPSSRTNMKLKPLNANIVVKVKKDSADSKTPGGLFIPLTADKGSHVEGAVVAVGVGYTLQDGSLRPLTVVEGNRVLFNKTTSTQIIDDEHFLLSESAVLGILT